jgi:hypothetical protein
MNEITANEKSDDYELLPLELTSVRTSGNGGSRETRPHPT